MARTPVVAQDIVLAGLAPVLSAVPGTGANNGISFDERDTFLVVLNAGTGVCTLTFDATAYVDGIALTDPTATCTNDSARRLYGPFGPSAFGGNVGVDFSLATGVTCGVVHLPR